MRRALLEYARLKALAVEFPADDYIVNALIFGKSSDFFFMFFALVLTLLIAGLFYRPVLRSVAGGIDRFNGTLGKLASWFVLFMAFQQIMIIFLQQVFRSNGLPISFFGLELVPGDDVLTMPWFATELLLYNAIIIAFACAYTFMDEGHVRVDLIYGAMSRRVKALDRRCGNADFPDAIDDWPLVGIVALGDEQDLPDYVVQPAHAADSDPQLRWPDPRRVEFQTDQLEHIDRRELQSRSAVLPAHPHTGCADADSSCWLPFLQP